MKTRSCQLAGMFYPKEPSYLSQMLENFFSSAGISGINAHGIVSPHAGYVYSGNTAAKAYSAIASGFDGTFVVIGPSHHGFSTTLSRIPWETPLGPVMVDTDLIDALSFSVHEETMAFGHENSIEVQIPFIRYKFPRARIVPLMMGPQTLQEVQRISTCLSQAISDNPRPVRIVASSDFSHYIPAEQARKNDMYAIEALLTLNTEVFFKRIHERGITACGYGPIAVMIETLKQVSNLHEAVLLSYTTSGDVTGDWDSVVAYAAMAVF